MPRNGTFVEGCDHRNPHIHGTRAGYKTCACRCVHCDGAQREYYRARKRDRRNYGEERTIDTGREHIRVLMGHGMSGKLIAEHAGVSPTTIYWIENGKAKGTTTTTEALILAVQPVRTAPRSTNVPITATTRRLRHLALMGWTAPEIAGVAGLCVTQVLDMTREKRPTVTKETAATIERATRALMRRTPPAGRLATRARNDAARKGWVSMFAYDNLDDPDETPNITPIQESRADTRTNRLDDLQHLIDSAESLDVAVRRAGYPSMDAAYAAARHSGREGLRQILSTRRTAA